MMPERNKLAALLVYAIVVLTGAHALLEVIGKLTFTSIQLEPGEDPQLLPWLTFGGLSSVIMAAANVVIVTLLLRLIGDGATRGSMLLKGNNWRMSIIQGAAIGASLLPLALLYTVLKPPEIEAYVWLFAADCVMSGRFWWGMLVVFCGQLYQARYLAEFNPDQYEL